MCLRCKFLVFPEREKFLRYSQVISALKETSVILPYKGPFELGIVEMNLEVGL
jgi:hypothetical protein